MRRALVLTSEHTRHPFRASLPPHVLRTREPPAPPAPDVPHAPRKTWLKAEDYGVAARGYAAGLIASTLFLM